MTDLWTPSPSEWYTAVLQHAYPDKGYIVAELSNGEHVFCHERALTFGGPGKHCYCLSSGTEMSVRIERQEYGTYPYKAIEAQIAADVNAPACREEVIVQNWTYNYGGVRRACGCGIFAWFQDKHDGAEFQIGETILVDVSFNQPRGDFIAVVVTDEEEAL